MFRNTFFVFFVFCLNSVYSQNNTKITGTLHETIQEKDSIYFIDITPDLNGRYYEVPFLKSVIVGKKFTINGQFSYPQMFRMKLQSEKNKIPFRNEFYFFDKSATIISVDSLSQNSVVNSVTGKEFKNVFVPFFVNGSNATKSMNELARDESDEFDSKLLEYVTKYPSSYVGLWFLVERFNSHGYSDKKKKIVNSFSQKIKSEKLWKIVNGEFQSMKFYEGAKVSQFVLKNTDLNEELFVLPENKYTLIDFWFSRCRPCVEQIPSLKEIYKKYNSEGFAIIGISTDRTEDIALWEKRIIDKEIPWKNYLDENSKVAFADKIYKYPTNFLVDSNGLIIKKDISPEELDMFLKEHLKG